MTIRDQHRPEISGEGHGLLFPGDTGFTAAATAWNHAGNHDPAVIAMAECVEDVDAAVRHAARAGLGVGVMATGHGTGVPVRGGLLINTSRMRSCVVDPDTRDARVEPGVSWAEVNDAAARHGLVGLVGSNSIVGVVGYTVGGGLGWFGRQLGLAAQSVVSARIVTAAGEVISADARHNTDLFWGLKGGVGNLGVAVSLSFKLYPITAVYGGTMLYPLRRGRRVLESYAGWVGNLSDEMTSTLAFMNMPDQPPVPRLLRGRSFAIVRDCYSGRDLHVGKRLLQDLRREAGRPLLSTMRRMAATDTDRIAQEPKDPVGTLLHTEMIPKLEPPVMDAVLDLALPAPASPLILLELRHLGGALELDKADLSPMGRSGAEFIINAAVTEQGTETVRRYLEHVADRLAPHTTGTVFANFVEGTAGQPGTDPNRLLRRGMGSTRHPEAALGPVELVPVQSEHLSLNSEESNKNPSPTLASAPHLHGRRPVAASGGRAKYRPGLTLYDQNPPPQIPRVHGRLNEGPPDLPDSPAPVAQRLERL